MNREQAIAKIKKCLALGRSSNEHEAAAAVRQAQALMREHGVTEHDAQMADVSEARSKARPPAINTWEAALARCIDAAFGTTHFHTHRAKLIGLEVKRWREVVFVGVGTAPEVASYAFDVLARQCAGARLVHVRKQPKSCKPITRTARGDQFAMGWVFAVQGLVDRFAGNPHEQLLIEHYMAARHPDLSSAKPRNTTVGRNVRNLDLEAGYSAGRSARLQHGLPGQASGHLLTGHQGTEP